jgi:RNA polymerase sigma factor (sigma-70 family)
LQVARTWRSRVKDARENVRFTGTVTDGQGRPIADVPGRATLHLKVMTAPFPGTYFVDEYPTPWSTRTGPDGRFAITGLCKGQYKLEFSVPGKAAVDREAIVTPELHSKPVNLVVDWPDEIAGQDMMRNDPRVLGRFPLVGSFLGIYGSVRRSNRRGGQDEPTGGRIMASGSHGAALRQIHRVFDEGTLAGLSEGQLLERFATRMDEAAFEVILARYGPMVLGVCHRFLHHSHDIEDAFQATFLILVRKAGSLKDRELLGHWLYGVAYRVAVRARAHAVRTRLRNESGIEDLRDVSDPSRESDWRDLSPVLDAEVNRLPERFRAPIILCLIEDRTHEEAARALGWPVGTVKSRLARGRERLRARLTRLGLAPSAALLGFALAPDPVRAAVPTALAHATLQAARRIAVGRAALGAASTTSAIALARGVLRSLALARLKTATLFLLAVTVTVAAIGTAGFVQVTPDSAPAPAVARLEPVPTVPGDPAPPPDSEKRTLDLRVVIAGTRRPIAGASVFLDRRAPDRLTTDAQGRCKVALEDIPLRLEGIISVWKDGFAPISIHFAHDDVVGDTFTSYTAELDPAGAIGGTVQDERGRPIAGAKVTVWLSQHSAAVRTERQSVDIGVSDPITTDAKGRWRLGMLPLSFKDTDYFAIKVTHPDYVSDVGGPSRPAPALKDLRNQSAVLVMAEGIPVRGVVLDTDGKPVKDARVSLALSPTDRYERYTTKADESGRFTFHTRPGEQAVCVQADRFAPALAEIVAGPDVKPMVIRLRSGRLIRGRVVDNQGQPVEGVTVRVGKWRSREVLDWEAKTDAQGRFRWENAPPGKITLIAHSRAGLSEPIEISAAAVANPAEAVIVAKTPLKLRGAVVDAASGRPVPRIRVIPGSTEVLPDRREMTRWRYEGARTFDAGRFEIDFDPYVYDRSSQYVRLEPEGYAPAISRAYQTDDGNQTWDVRLAAGLGVSGIVRLPDGPPAAGADAILVTPSEDAMFRNGRLDLSRSHADRQRTGPDGRFWFARPNERFLLVILSDRGFAMRSEEEVAANPDVMLQPWGRIEGSLLLGSRPGADEVVVASSPFARAGGPRVTFEYEAETDDRGRFVLDRVMPGGLTLERGLGYHPGMPYPKSHLGYVEVQPGRSVSVTVGATGRPLVGRLVLPPDAGPLMGLASGWCLMIRDLRPPYPKEYAGWDGARILSWWGEFHQTESGRAYSRQSRTYAAVVGNDGTFRIENVDPGTYKLSFVVPHIQIGGQGRVWRRLFGKANRELVVPEIPGGRSDQPLDLGRIELTPTNATKLEVGEVASPFTIKAIDGKPLRLLAYRGKYVLVAFWTTWSGPCLAEIPQLKAVYEEFGADPRFVMIGLSLDEDAEAPRQFAATQGLGWIQGHLPTESLSADYGVMSLPKIVLIGPDGRVVAKDLSGDRIKQAVAKALGRAQSPARAR